jgi:cell division initiation protein
MKITPLDIKKQEFKKTLRGYDTIEVDAFLDMMANEFEDLLRQQKENRDKAVELEVQLRDYRQIEKTLQQTLLQAQETTGKTYESARKEAELIVREAEQKAARLVETAADDVARSTRELADLRARKETLVGRLKVLLSAELELLRTLELGGSDDFGGDPSRGTGKDRVELDKVLKNIDHERSA